LKENDLSNSVVSVIGGTGSFGSTMVNSLLASSAAEIRVLSRDETKQDAMRHSLGNSRVKFYIGDVRDKDSIKSCIQGSDLVFHASALKQVPSCEFFPIEAVKTNILGSHNVLMTAIDSGVKSVVCLSTDKAVYPINAMGMSKALMEKTAMAIAREHQQSGTKIAITRYGNVMASRGSVIPLFIKQIQERKPVTITNRNMTRFLMNLDESVDLVNHAFKEANSGDLFVRKAPAATIDTLLQALTELMGLTSVETINVGVRHGEKLYESLLSSEELGRAQDEGDYFRVPLDTRELDYSSFVENGVANDFVEESYNSHNTVRLDVEGVKSLLVKLPAVKEVMK